MMHILTNINNELSHVVPNLYDFLIVHTVKVSMVKFCFDPVDLQIAIFLCSTKERQSNLFGNYMRVSNDDRIFTFG